MIVADEAKAGVGATTGEMYGTGTTGGSGAGIGNGTEAEIGAVAEAATSTGADTGDGDGNGAGAVADTGDFAAENIASKSGATGFMETVGVGVMTGVGVGKIGGIGAAGAGGGVGKVGGFIDRYASSTSNDVQPSLINIFVIASRVIP
ncbi:MAG: hypothetical protein WCG02_00295 [Candidatus Taylorbacteria bacterium]